MRIAPWAHAAAVHRGVIAGVTVFAVLYRAQTSTEVARQRRVSSALTEIPNDLVRLTRTSAWR